MREGKIIPSSLLSTPTSLIHGIRIACLVAAVASSTIHDEELDFEVQMENRSPRESWSRNGFHHRRDQRGNGGN